MKFRMRVITPLGTFQSDLSEEATPEEYAELEDAQIFINPTNMRFEDEEGNYVFFQQDLIRNSIIVLVPEEAS